MCAVSEGSEKLQTFFHFVRWPPIGEKSEEQLFLKKPGNSGAIRFWHTSII